MRVASVNAFDERIRRRARADRRQIQPQAVQNIESIVDRPLIFRIHRVVRRVELRVEARAEVQSDRIRIWIPRLERIETRERIAPLGITREQIVDLVELVVRADAQPMLRADRDREVVRDLEDVLVERVPLRVRFGARYQRARDPRIDRDRWKGGIGRPEVANRRVAEKQLVVRSIVPVREELSHCRVLLVVEAVRVRSKAKRGRKSKQRVELRLAVVVANHETAVVWQHEVEAREDVRQRIVVRHGASRTGVQSVAVLQNVRHSLNRCRIRRGCRARRSRERTRCRIRLGLPLRRDEEVNLVLHDRSANREPVLLLLELARAQ